MPLSLNWISWEYFECRSIFTRTSPAFEPDVWLEKPCEQKHRNAQMYSEPSLGPNSQSGFVRKSVEFIFSPGARLRREEAVNFLPADVLNFETVHNELKNACNDFKWFLFCFQDFKGICHLSLFLFRLLWRRHCLVRIFLRFASALV